MGRFCIGFVMLEEVFVGMRMMLTVRRVMHNVLMIFFLRGRFFGSTKLLADTVRGEKTGHPLGCGAVDLRKFFFDFGSGASSFEGDLHTLRSK